LTNGNHNLETYTLLNDRSKRLHSAAQQLGLTGWTEEHF